MIDLTFDVDYTALTARFEQLPDDLQRALEPVIERLTAEVLAREIAAEPSLTGKLREQTQSAVHSGDGWVRGKTFIVADDGKHNVKAGALEWGVDRRVHISEHEMLLAHLWGRQVDPVDVVVSEYARAVDVAEHRFVRDAVEGIAGQVHAEVEAAVNSVTNAF
jgi:hypothetical protein